MRFLLFFICSIIATDGYLQTLDLTEIMKGPDFVGHLPNSPFWDERAGTIYFNWNRDTQPDEELYRYSIGGQLERVPLSDLPDIPSSVRIYNRNHSMLVYEKHGDLFFQDLQSGKKTQITNTVEIERDPAFSSDQKDVLFKSAGNIYSWSIEGGMLTQLSDFEKGSDKKDSNLLKQRIWLERDQLEYFEILRQRKSHADFNAAQAKLVNPKRPRKIYLNGDELSSMEISPDLRFVIYQIKKGGNSKSTIVPDYVTQSGYVSDLTAREKVGDEQDKFHSFIYDRIEDTVYQIKTSDIPGIYEKPAYLRDYYEGLGAYVDTFESPRDVIIHGPFFNQVGNLAAVVIRSQDNKDRWIMSLDLATGKLSLIDRQRDEAWVGGPGIEGWNQSAGNIGFLGDDETVWYQSEESGFSHIQTYNFKSSTNRALTSGNFEILEARLSRDKTTFYIISNRENPFENHFYHFQPTTGIWKKISSQPGNHEVVISPDEARLAVLYSYSNKPTELFWMENRPDAELHKVTSSTTEQFNQYPWRDPEIIRFKARDGVMVPARLYEPEEEKRNGAAVIFVHGAGYLHNVHRWWSSYYREYMFHNLMADEGYTVLDIDYRGSAGYGRDWRTAIYRHMGGQDLQDQLDGAKFLVESKAVDPQRIGIYGGSYGGFITLMALCTSPGTFNCGAALRSVTDWAHYNHAYTSNILNTPATDSLAYYRSSPIYHAEGLQGQLLMLHGMVDRNVQFQDVVRMSQRFIELGKENWELAVFPMEDHGFVESSSWADEYRRIYKLFQENLSR